MRQEQCVHQFRHLVSRVVANARHFGELIWRRDEFTRSFRSRPPNRAILIARPR